MAEKGSGSNNRRQYNEVILSKDKVEELPILPSENHVISIEDEMKLTWNQYIGVKEPPISKCQGLPTVTHKDYTDPSEAGLGWSFVTDEKGTSNSGFLVTEELKESDEENYEDHSKEDGQEGIVMPKENSSTTGSLLCRLNAEGYSVVELNMSSRECGTGIISDEVRATYSSHKDTGLSKTNNNYKEVISLVSQKGHPYVQNCDLPPSQTTFSWKGPLSRCDGSSLKMEKPSSSLSSDKLLMEALIRLNEPSSSEKTCLPTLSTLLGTSDPTPFFDHSLSNTSRPLTIPSAFPQLSNANRQDKLHTVAS
mgnify:FL=1